MIQLKAQVIERMLHQETAQKEDLGTILRCIYTRYMRLYEHYFADIDALNNETVAGMRKYHEETMSLVKYYYMDIPLDICIRLEQFEEKCTDLLLGPAWRVHLHEGYEEFREKHEKSNPGGNNLKDEFRTETMKAFYDAMGYIFREGFGTDSQTARNVLSGITDLLFGKQ